MAVEWEREGFCPECQRIVPVNMILPLFPAEGPAKPRLALHKVYLNAGGSMKDCLGSRMTPRPIPAMGTPLSPIPEEESDG